MLHSASDRGILLIITAPNCFRKATDRVEVLLEWLLRVVRAFIRLSKPKISLRLQESAAYEAHWMLWPNVPLDRDGGILVDALGTICEPSARSPSR
jgi:hypothetical protein